MIFPGAHILNCWVSSTTVDISVLASVGVLFTTAPPLSAYVVLLSLEVLNQWCIRDLMIGKTGAHAFEMLLILEQGLASYLWNLVYLFPYPCSSQSNEQLFQELLLYLLPCRHETSKEEIKSALSVILQGEWEGSKVYLLLGHTVRSHSVTHNVEFIHMLMLILTYASRKRGK